LTLQLVLSPLSWVAVAVMAVSVAAALSRRLSATWSLILGNVGVFLITVLGPSVELRNGLSQSVVQRELWLQPSNLHPLSPLGGLQLLTNLSVHADLLHILGNMIFLAAFGAPFEARIGGRRLTAIYLASGVLGSLCQYAAGVAGHDDVPMLGASGAIFGVMCAFATRFPNQVIGVPVPLFFLLLRIPMRVLYGALFWVAWNVVYVFALATPGAATDNVGYFAHLGGGAAGVVLALLLLRNVAAPTGRRGPIAIDLSALGPFARDTPTKDALAHMRQNHDEPAVFQAWLDRFFRTATCPTCSHRVMPRHRGEVVCTQGHAFDVRRDRSAPIVSAAPAR